ncbi:hypothetical protein F4775DRAFT_576801 [Biscogniauxia sp. FL1348]|nr:hypothetical protein F4775DRAFT_576801 [Biscogniauxia sp. FL1348]
MNNNHHTTTSYTPLESLFLFQLLNRYGFVNGSFHRISEELKSTPLVFEQDNYDAARLSPESLQELALQLVREEQRREAEASTDKNGPGLSPNSRKRKLPSPPLPSLKEAHEQPDKLPVLVDRLYSRFRENIVREIREDERRIELLQRDIGDIERAIAQDKRLESNKNGAPVVGEQRPARPNGQTAPPTAPTAPIASVAPTAPAVPTPVPVPTPVGIPPKAQDPARRVEQPPAPQPPPDRRTIQPSPSPLPPANRPPGDIRQPTPDRRSQEPIRPPNGTTPVPVLQHPQAVQGYGPRPPSATPQPPTTDGLQRPEGLPKGRSPVPGQANQPQAPALKWEPPYQPPHPPLHQAPPHQPTPHHQPHHHQPSHQAHQAHQPHQPPHQTPVPSPRPPYNTGTPRPPPYPPQISPSHPQHPHGYMSGRQSSGQYTQQPRFSPQGTGPSSPSVLLPPQNAGQIPPSLQSLPVNAAPDGAGQLVPQRRPPSVPAASSPAPSVPPSAFTHHQSQGPPTQTPVRPPVGLAAAPATGNATKPPVPAAQRPPTASPARPPYQQPPLPSTPTSQQHPPHGNLRSYSSPYNHQAQLPSGALDSTQRPPVPPIQTPVTAPHSARPHSVTSVQTPQTANAPSHVIRGHGTKWTSTPTPATPRVEEISGYFDSQSPAFEPISPPLQPIQLPRSSPSQTEKKDIRKSIQKLDIAATKANAKPPRPAQSSAPTPQAEEPATEQDLSGRPIKNEVATPRAFEEAGDTTADESVHSRQQAAVSNLPAKRKRQDSPVSRAPPAPATHVLWTRSFNKISMAALDQIIGHRHANMFAQPLKPRDAPGYHDYVLRPQDLKGIQKAITAGSKAAAAAVATLPDIESNAPAVWLPISVDLVPPRGIINIAQLERELDHMFANAIMYNPDPQRGLGPSFLKAHQSNSEVDDKDTRNYQFDENGVVKETRNMFREVEKLLGDLRSEVVPRAPPPTGAISRSMSATGGEASTVEDEADEQAGDAKRRRIRG